jgi:hypothetical protein
VMPVLDRDLAPFRRAALAKQSTRKQNTLREKFPSSSFNHESTIANARNLENSGSVLI